MDVGDLIEPDGPECVWYVRELLREGAEVDLCALRRSLTRLSQSSRRTHRDCVGRVLRRLASV